MTPALQAVLLGGSSFYPGATLALDFLAQKYRVSGINTFTPDFASLPNLTVTRATPALSYDLAGTMSFAANVARIVPGFGLLVEESRTNLFLNSFAPATQNVTITAQSYTITVWGTGSVTIAAGTATISNAGSASAGSPRTIGCTVGGTISVTVTGSPSIVQVEAGAFGTSPIPTLGASVTRAGDSVSIPSWVNPTNGTAFAQFQGSPASTSDRVIGSAANPALIYQNNALGVGTFDGTTTLNRAAGVTGRIKAAVAWTPSSRLITAAGLASASDANGPGAVPTIFLGSQNGSTLFLDNYIEKIVVYPTNYSDAQLQSITA